MGRVGPACRRFVRYYRNRVFRAFFHALALLDMDMLALELLGALLRPVRSPIRADLFEQPRRAMRQYAAAARGASGDSVKFEAYKDAGAKRLRRSGWGCGPEA